MPLLEGTQSTTFFPSFSLHKISQSTKMGAWLTRILEGLLLLKSAAVEVVREKMIQVSEDNELDLACLVMVYGYGKRVS